MGSRVALRSQDSYQGHEFRKADAPEGRCRKELVIKEMIIESKIDQSGLGKTTWSRPRSTGLVREFRCA